MDIEIEDTIFGANEQAHDVGGALSPASDLDTTNTEAAPGLERNTRAYCNAGYYMYWTSGSGWRRRRRYYVCAGCPTGKVYPMSYQILI